MILLKIMDWIIFILDAKQVFGTIPGKSCQGVSDTILGFGRKAWTLTAEPLRSIWYQLQLCQKLETTFVLLSAAHKPLILTLYQCSTMWYSSEVWQHENLKSGSQSKISRNVFQKKELLSSVHKQFVQDLARIWVPSVFVILKCSFKPSWHKACNCELCAA